MYIRFYFLQIFFPKTKYKLILIKYYCKSKQINKYNIPKILNEIKLYFK